MSSNYINMSEMLAEIEISFKYECLYIAVDFINVCVFPPSGGYDYHMHSNYEFHFIKEGKGIVILNGTEYRLEAGSFYLTGPGVVHKQIADNVQPMVEYAMKCDLAFDTSGKGISRHSAAEYKYMLDMLNTKSAQVVNDSNNLCELFERVLEEVRNKRAGFYAQIKNIVMQIIIAAARNYDKWDTIGYQIPKRDIAKYRMDIIRSYTTDNYFKNITCKELADQLFLSTRQLNRIVREQTGCSVHDFILSQRIEKVKGLLLNTELKLSQIAENTGFSSEFHLSNAFKKWLGISPAAFREKGRVSF